MKMKLEYIWLDGNEVQLLRSKTKILETKTPLNEIKSEDLPIWNYDGSSTSQAECGDSEMLLKPVNTFKDPFREDSLLVMCSVYNSDMTPHETNKRYNLLENLKYDDESWFGFEQEYIIYDNETKRPLGWSPMIGTYPKPQGDYYCGVGANHVSGRTFVEEHLDACLRCGIEISGINAEVMLGQWEYQVGPVTALDGSDQLWISRYIMYRLGEKYNYTISIDPKPFKGEEWNGSGLHANFSTKELRENFDKKVEISISYCKKLENKHKDHILVYGMGNQDRLNGSNETATLDEFTWGEGDRTASIRIPSSINDSKTPGYIEDRRPASNADPYIIANKMIETILKN